MKAFIVACVAIVVLAVGASYVLDRYQQPVDQAFTTRAVRI
jgi:hypothetical protein